MTDAIAIVTAGATLATALIIYWQGSLLKAQIALQTLIDLESQWNDPAMRRFRAEVVSGTGGDELNRLERVIEFLENFATYHERGALDSRRVWDSNLGWYASRYYFYQRDAIKRIRERWHDETVYKNLEKLCSDYMQIEAGIRGVAVAMIEKQFSDTEKEFIALESQ